MARLKYYNENTGEWVYADIAGGGSSGGGGNIAIVEYSTDDFQEFTPDMTFAEILAIVNDGGIVRARIDGTGLIGKVMYFDLVSTSESGIEFSNVRTEGEYVECITFTHSSDNSVSVISHNAT